MAASNAPARGLVIGVALAVGFGLAGCSSAGDKSSADKVSGSVEVSEEQKSAGKSLPSPDLKPLADFKAGKHQGEAMCVVLYRIGDDGIAEVRSYQQQKQNLSAEEILTEVAAAVLAGS